MHHMFIYVTEILRKNKSNIAVNSYIVQYSILRTAQSTLLETCSIKHHLNLSGKYPKIVYSTFKINILLHCTLLSIMTAYCIFYPATFFT